jgi:hypothetical protein
MEGIIEGDIPINGLSEYLDPLMTSFGRGLLIA